ncbi:hypothetical protein [Streptomyces lavendulae]|uniref:hypothetical protein n=1 Tax=Streptomyces lavendulae TaxID=1914 RepID=UPI00369B84AE
MVHLFFRLQWAACLAARPSWYWFLPFARVGRAAVVQWRRRYDDFPALVGGTDVHPEFDRAVVLAWLLVHGKIEMPARTPIGALLMARSGGGTRTVRLDDPF